MTAGDQSEIRSHAEGDFKSGPLAEIPGVPQCGGAGPDVDIHEARCVVGLVEPTYQRGHSHSQQVWDDDG